PASFRDLRKTGGRVAVVAERAGEPLREVGPIAREPPCSFAKADREDPVDAAGVEVLHRQLPVEHPNDRDRVGNLWMVVLRAPDQKSLTPKPLERALTTDRAGQRLMRGL